MVEVTKLDKRRFLRLGLFCVVMTFVFVGVATDYPSCLGTNFMLPWLFCASAVGFAYGAEGDQMSRDVLKDILGKDIFSGFVGLFLMAWIGLIFSMLFVGVGWLLAGLFFGGLVTEVFGMTDYVRCLR